MLPNFLMKKYAYFCYAAKTKNPRKVLIYRDFLCFAILSSGEIGSRTYTFTESHKTANN